MAQLSKKMHSQNDHYIQPRRNLHINVAFIVFASIYFFAAQSYFFTHEFRPDEIKALGYFLNFFRLDSGTVDETWVRLILTLFNVFVSCSLAASGLIDRRTFILAAIWPLTFFLFSKIYWEFFVFPLCLVRLDLRRAAEFKFLLFLIFTLIITEEANIMVLILFRLILLAQKFGAKMSAPASVLLSSIFLDALLSSGSGKYIPVLGPYLHRFDWTRSVANPEYSILETVAVFLSSFHFFSLHDGSFWVDAIFSIAVIVVIFKDRNSLANLRDNFDYVAAFAATIFFFTHVTHVFQNARYYFFFIAVLSYIVPQRKFSALGLLGIFHVGVRALFL